MREYLQKITQMRGKVFGEFPVRSWCLSLLWVVFWCASLLVIPFF